MKRIYTLLCLGIGLLFAASGILNAQCLTLDVKLDQRVNSASLIIDGEVTSQSCFQINGMIYTENQIKVFKVFKGSVPTNGIISLITLGGQVGDDILKVNPSLQLRLGQSGMLMMNNWHKDNNKYLTVFDAMGFITYDVVDRTAQDIYHTYGDIKSTFLPQIQGLLNSETKEINTAFYEKGNFERRVTPTISGLSASTIEAGADKILTITGNNFEATQGSNGKVEFKDGNSGGTTWYEAHRYKSWSNTQIEVYVPSRAGTGTIRVTNNSNDNRISTQSITVPYSNLNAVFLSEPDNPYVTRHKEDNGTNNDINWQFNSTFFDSTEAKEAFIRSIETWRCGTFMPWNVLSNTTSISDYEANDGINLVSWDNFLALPTNVLGRCYSRWQACGPTGSRNVYVNELDIVFNRSRSWHYALSNAPGGKLDFVSVCAHELGHGHQLGHVIDGAKMMHFSIGPGQTKRALSTGDIDGANNVHARSVNGICSRTPIILLNAGNCSVVGTTVNFGVSKTNACRDEVVVFTDSTQGAGTTWNWNFGSNAVPPTASGIGPHSVRYTTQGKKTVTLSVGTASGTVDSTKTDYLDINPDPKVNAKAVFSNFGNNRFRFYSENGSSYNNKWYFNNDNDSLTADTIYLTFPSPGSYTVKLKASNNCNDTTITINLTDWTHIEELENVLIDVYPNPAQSSFKIKTAESRFEHISILDLAGRVVLRQPFKVNEEINISTLRKGIYLLQLHFNNSTITTKLIKE